MIGQQISHYRVTAKIGEGGMGEVYRATDTKLGRDVALKVLPEAFAQDDQRMQRFQREAQVLASLNHPRIAAIYGLEHQDKIQALAMELVEGPTLAERIALGAIPLEEALPIAKQIAEALEYAHERGIIHRDLKPANIKLTPDGNVKVLDFGLAKALQGDAAQLDASNSPTISVAATKAGIILGTAAYMSPEQARGKPADRRADIWSFGVVLFEMLTGRQVYSGETGSDVLAKVLEREPDWNSLPANLPRRVRELLRRCLKKDVKQRLQAIGDARIAIEEALGGTDEVASVRELPLQKHSAHAMRWGLAGLMVGAIGVSLAVWSLVHTPRSPARPIVRLVVTLPPANRLSFGFLPATAFAPDSSRLAYVADYAGRTQLYIRAIDRFEATPIPGTEGAESPFFSPDGQSVGFFADGKLKRVSLSGGAPFTLCVAASNRGASWGPNNTIIFTPAATSGMFEVSATGGTPKQLTTPDRSKGEVSHRWPVILPGGKAVLFNLWRGGSFDNAQIAVFSLETGERRVLVEGGTYPRYVSSGHLVYARAGGLVAVPFDLQRLEVTGSPVSIVEGVSMNASGGWAEFSFSADGSLAYSPGGTKVSERTLFWVDRKGEARPLSAPPRSYLCPRISPDGQRLAVGSENTDLWLYDLSRGAMTWLTSTSALALPIWTPDSKRVTFRAMVSSSLNLHWIPIDGSRTAERLTTSENMHSPSSWSPDGQVLAFSENDPTTGWDIWLLKLESERKPRPFLQTTSNEGGAVFSPDGHWLAYQSDESGRQEIYVRPFPGPGGKTQISTEGGTQPIWARNGRELFYRSGDKMMAAAIETKPVFAADKPKLLFEGHFERGIFSFTFQPNYDVSPDGQRFLMIKASEQDSAATQLNVVLNWSDELRQRVPPGKK